jgi:hypothetical protein
LTNNFNNLNVRSEEYAGNDQIQVGDGTSLHITHLGKASLSAHSKSFILDQILVVPQITKKSYFYKKKFFEDNFVYFEFHASCLSIKDYSGNTLHKGVVKDGLYCFSQPLQHLYPKALVGVRVSISDWHCHPGHASYNTINHVICSNNLSFCRTCAASRRVFHFKSRKCVWYLSGKYGETRKYCLLLVENGMGVAT